LVVFQKGRFKAIYGGHQVSVGKKLKDFRRDIAKVGAGIVGLIIIAQTLIFSAQSFSDQMGISLPVIGILIIGLGNCFPEIYFGIAAAKNGKQK
jgi:Sodium/calcium exchanger protein.